MVLPNAVIAAYYAWAGRADIVYSSQIGDGLGVSNSMDERARAVDREVFMRELRYYELRAGSSEQ